MIEILKKFGILRFKDDDPVIKPINRIGNFIEFNIQDTNYVSFATLKAHPDNANEYPTLVLFKDSTTAILGSTVPLHEITKVSIMHVTYNNNIIPYHIYLS